MCKGSLPLDRAGTFALPKLPERQLITEYLGHYHISEEFLAEHFTAMFQQFLGGLVKCDYASIEKVTEPRFFNKLQGLSDDLRKFQLKY